MSPFTQMLVCADARILLEQEGLAPEPEILDGQDTGRVKHQEIDNGVDLFFGPSEQEGETVKAHVLRVMWTTV